MPLSIRGQLQCAAKLQQMQSAGQRRHDSCFRSRRTALATVSSQTRRAADTAQPPARSCSASAQARLARLAAVPDLTLADVSLPQLKDLPSLDNPWQVLGYLLQHPLAALLVGGGLAVVVPRIVRASVRFILVPAAVALLLYLAARNPGFVWGGVSSAASAVVQHPVATSAAILAASSLLLSPYILLAGAALVLLTGTQLLPGFLRPALPGPVSEALRQVDVLQGQTRSALDSLAAAVQPAPALKDGKK